jgi:AbrB family looped-hinge helix DNA binding protein
MRVSADGQIALPGPIRERLRIRAGDLLDAAVEVDSDGERIVLTPNSPREKYELKLTTDPVTGWPVLSAGPDAPVMTSEDVAELLVDFP